MTGFEVATLDAVRERAAMAHLCAQIRSVRDDLGAAGADCLATVALRACDPFGRAMVRSVVAELEDGDWS